MQTFFLCKLALYTANFVSQPYVFSTFIAQASYETKTMAW